MSCRWLRWELKEGRPEFAQRKPTGTPPATNWNRKSKDLVEFREGEPGKVKLKIWACLVTRLMASLQITLISTKGKKIGQAKSKYTWNVPLGEIKNYTLTNQAFLAKFNNAVESMLGNSEFMPREISRVFILTWNGCRVGQEREHLLKICRLHDTTKRKERDTIFFLPARLLVGLFSFGLTIGIDLLVRKYFPWNVGIWQVLRHLLTDIKNKLLSIGTIMGSRSIVSRAASEYRTPMGL